MNKQKGFTLLEMIVALGIFSIVAVLTAGTIVSFNRVQKKTINIQNAHDNIRYALETMARAIRTGDAYCKQDAGLTCSGGSSVCAWSTGGCDTFAFRESISGSNYVYRRGVVAGKGIIERSTDGVNFTIITDPRIDITKLRFYVSGITDSPYALSSTEQQKVTIVVEIRSGTGTQISQLNMQTTVTKRKLF